MASIFQDTTFGHFLRFASGSKLLPWPETIDSATRQAYLQARPSLPLHESKDLDSSDNEAAVKETRTIIDWTENDAENPHNWSSAKKAWAFSLIALLTTSVYVGASIYTVGLEGISQRFHVSNTVALLGLTVFIVGYGIGPIIWCPIAERPSVGRTPVYIGTLVVFVAFQPAIIYAKNIGMLLAFRFLTGFFGSPALALGGATAADLYSPQKLNYAISIWGAAAAFGPALGPVIAGFAVQYKGWTWSIWELFWISGFCLVALILFLPETLEGNILHRRAQRLQHVADSEGEIKRTIISRPDAEAELVDSAKEGREILFGIITLSLFEPLVLILNLYISLIYALLYLWFESLPLVFIGIHKFSLGSLGLAFLGLFVGVFIGVFAYCIYLRLRVEPMYTTPGRKFTPEVNMEPAMVGCFLIPIAMLIFAWTSRSDVHWIVPIFGTLIFTPGMFIVFVSVIGYLASAYPRQVAAVFAGNDLMRSGCGAAFPLFANAMFKKLGIDWGNTLLALLTALFIPVPFILVKYGGKIRKMSKKALQDED